MGLAFKQETGFSNFDDSSFDDRPNEPWEEWRKRHGWKELDWQIGSRNSVYAEAFSRKESPKYLVGFTDSNNGINIYVDDEASLFTLRMKLSKMVFAELFANYFEGFEENIRRTFRLMHGHEEGEICNRCAPRWEIDAEEKRRNEALAKRNAEKGAQKP